MFRAIQLIFNPAPGWTRIITASPGYGIILAAYLLPLLLVAGAAEGCAMVQFAGGPSQLEQSVLLTVDKVVRYEILRLGLCLAAVFLGAQMVRWVSESFDFKPPYLRCFTLGAYGLGPFFLARLLNCVPGLNPWIGWGVGWVVSIHVLYQGVGIALEPQQTKGFGMLILSVLVFSFMTVFVHILSLMAVQGKIPL